MKLHIIWKCSECGYEQEKFIDQAGNEKFYTYAYICPSPNHDSGIPMAMEIKLLSNQTNNSSDQGTPHH